MIHTQVCELLGIQVPVFAAPMGPDITGPELTAAVSNAGGLGITSFGADPPSLLRAKIGRIRKLTDKPFGVNFILGTAFPVEEQIFLCIEERVPVLSFFYGDASPYISLAHAAGLKVIDQVGTVKAAQASVKAGADVIIAQGAEAGGHLKGEVAAMVLVPRVVDAVKAVPVIAAGGIADARGMVAALSLGADGVVLGTRLIASNEANAHMVYKQKILEASEEDTVRTTLFGGGWPNAPHRSLLTKFVKQWIKEETRGSEQRSDEPVIAEMDFMGLRVPVQRFAGLPPMKSATGDIESMAMLAGQSVGLVQDIKPAADIINEIVEGAEHIINNLLSQINHSTGRL